MNFSEIYHTEYHFLVKTLYVYPYPLWVGQKNNSREVLLTRMGPFFHAFPKFIKKAATKRISLILPEINFH